MSQAMRDSLPAACPRCRSGTIEVHGTSPVAGVWAVFACAACLYVWRSTEPGENTSPDKYPEPFRLKPEHLAGLPVAPQIPPFRRPPGDK
jgi:vanillate/4-hydroxybenzoate decarboxylase subunit D